MKLELQQKLFKECPELFKFHNHEGPPYWPIKFGIETEDGWDNIILELCSKLEPHVKNTAVGCVQIKEKFGGLRFYMSDLTDETEKLINDAEHKSFHTCERCGNKGVLVSTKRKWLLTLCSKCEEKVNS